MGRTRAKRSVKRGKLARGRGKKKGAVAYPPLRMQSWLQVPRALAPEGEAYMVDPNYVKKIDEVKDLPLGAPAYMNNRESHMPGAYQPPMVSMVNPQAPGQWNQRQAPGPGGQWNQRQAPGPGGQWNQRQAPGPGGQRNQQPGTSVFANQSVARQPMVPTVGQTAPAPFAYNENGEAMTPALASMVASANQALDDFSGSKQPSTDTIPIARPVLNGREAQADLRATSDRPQPVPGAPDEPVNTEQVAHAPAPVLIEDSEWVDLIEGWKKDEVDVCDAMVRFKNLEAWRLQLNPRYGPDTMVDFMYLVRQLDSLYIRLYNFVLPFFQSKLPQYQPKDRMAEQEKLQEEANWSLYKGKFFQTDNWDKIAFGPDRLDALKGAQVQAMDHAFPPLIKLIVYVRQMIREFVPLERKYANMMRAFLALSHLGLDCPVEAPNQACAWFVNPNKGDEKAVYRGEPMFNMLQSLYGVACAFVADASDLSKGLRTSTKLMCTHIENSRFSLNDMIIFLYDHAILGRYEPTTGGATDGNSVCENLHKKMTVLIESFADLDGRDNNAQKFMSYDQLQTYKAYGDSNYTLSSWNLQAFLFYLQNLGKGRAMEPEVQDRPQYSMLYRRFVEFLMRAPIEEVVKYVAATSDVGKATYFGPTYRRYFGTKAELKQTLDRPSAFMTLQQEVNRALPGPENALIRERAWLSMFLVALTLHIANMCSVKQLVDNAGYYNWSDLAWARGLYKDRHARQLYTYQGKRAALFNLAGIGEILLVKVDAMPETVAIRDHELPSTKSGYRRVAEATGKAIYGGVSSLVGKVGGVLSSVFLRQKGDEKKQQDLIRQDIEELNTADVGVPSIVEVNSRRYKAEVFHSQAALDGQPVSNSKEPMIISDEPTGGRSANWKRLPDVPKQYWGKYLHPVDQPYQRISAWDAMYGEERQRS